MMRTLSEEEARALLSAVRIGRLGCVDNGEPYVVPINYVFEDDSIYSLLASHCLLRWSRSWREMQVRRTA